MLKEEIIDQTIKVLNNGGIILYPTDTVWGIGCDATNKKAIEKIYKIKKRQSNKPLIILTHTAQLLEQYICTVPKIAYKYINQYQEPTTIIYEQPKNLPDILIYNNTIGIRVVKEDNLNLLLASFKKPITSTSANISNSKNPLNFSEIDSHIKNNVDYIVPEKFMKLKKNTKASKIIQISSKNVQVIRE